MSEWPDDGSGPSVLVAYRVAAGIKTVVGTLVQAQTGFVDVSFPPWVTLVKGADDAVTLAMDTPQGALATVAGVLSVPTNGGLIHRFGFSAKGTELQQWLAATPGPVA